MCRYELLNKIVGIGATTNIVLLKCLLDQFFFATQQDFLFLIVCAYNNKAELPAAIEEVKKSFLTTWILDCSLWPLVNFVGFSFVPAVILPTYMACVSYFWQLYMSNTACEKIALDDESLRIMFNELDLDRVSDACSSCG